MFPIFFELRSTNPKKSSSGPKNYLADLYRLEWINNCLFLIKLWINLLKKISSRTKLRSFEDYKWSANRSLGSTEITASREMLLRQNLKKFSDDCDPLCLDNIGKFKLSAKECKNLEEKHQNRKPLTFPSDLEIKKRIEWIT